jgi:hypothetical protein
MLVNYRQLKRAASEATHEPLLDVSAYKATAERLRRPPTPTRKVGAIPGPGNSKEEFRLFTVSGFSFTRRPVRRNQQLNFQTARSASQTDSD